MYPRYVSVKRPDFPQGYHCLLLLSRGNEDPIYSSSAGETRLAFQYACITNQVLTPITPTQHQLLSSLYLVPGTITRL